MGLIPRRLRRTNKIENNLIPRGLAPRRFIADLDQIGYSLGGGRYTFGVQAPDEDIIEIGVGFGATINDRLEIVLDLDAQHSDLYQATIVGARAMYEF